MAAKRKSKMPVSERAKQFAPFSPLSGLAEALRKVEERVEQRVEDELTAEKSEEDI